MKRWCAALLLALLLTGCAGAKTLTLSLIHI